MRKCTFLLALLVLAIPCSSEIITVDDDGVADFTTIQAAIDDANDGDMVIVSPGIYNEIVDFAGKDIVLTSTDPNDTAVVATTVIIDERPGGLAVKTCNSSLLGLTISGGLSIERYGTATGGSPTISHCYITSTSKAIEVRGYVSPIIENNIIRSGTCGIYFWETRELIVRNNVIIGDSTDYGSGFVYRMHTALPTVTGNIITNWRDGIHLTYHSLENERKALIKYNNVWGNTHNYWIDTSKTAFDMTGIQGNMSQDPLFVNFAGGDFHLQSISPCIDAGDPSANYSGKTDIEGEPRVIGSRVDMGVDEFAYEPESMVGLTIFGPEQMRENSSAQYTAIAYDNDGLWVNVSSSGIWSLEPNECGSFDDHGVLSLGRMETLESVTIYAKYLAGEVVLEAEMPVGISVPSRLYITGELKLGENVSEQYTATAQYEDGTLVKVTNLAVWWVEPEEVGNFDENGLLTTGSIDICDGITIYAQYTVGGTTIEDQLPVLVSLPVDLEITGAQEVVENSQQQYKAVAYYDTGRAIDVTGLALWQAVPENVANIEGGLLQTNYVDETQDVIIYGTFTYCGQTVEGQISVRVHSIDIWYVPSDYQTIQQAIDVAGYRDIVIVADNVYTGDGNRDIDFRGKVISVRSENGPNNCIIDCQGTEAEPHRGFYFHSGEDANSVLDGFTITNGYASGDWTERVGGGIRCDNSSPTIINCIITGNLAYWDGGGMNNENSNPVIENCTFIENSAVRNDGGAINNDNSSPTITNCTFEGNSAYDWGGGIRNIYLSSPTLTNCVFTGNSSDEGGGIFNYDNSRPRLTDCTFTANSAKNEGGGMYNRSDCSPELTNCIFTENGRGGMKNYWYSSPILTNCTFTGNYGSGMYNDEDCSPTLTNCTFSGNWSEGYGGGMYNDEYSAPLLVNCTFSANSAYYGGGIYNRYHSTAKLTNCIVWDNNPPQICGSASVSYSNIQDGWDGTGNIDADPLFVDADGADNIPGTEDDNLRLLGGSPCIDAGNNAKVPQSVVVDLDGMPRFADDPDTIDTGSGTPPIVDMGAYEGPHQGFLLSADVVIVPEGETETFTVVLAMAPLGRVEATVVWQSGDTDISVESGGTLIFDSSNYAQPQTVTLVAAEDDDYLNDGVVFRVSAPGFFAVSIIAIEKDNEPVPAILYVDGSVSVGGIGRSWSDAFSSLQDALWVATEYSEVKEIHVAQGIYKPDHGDGITPGDREASFQLVNGLAIKGSYAGLGESHPNDRNVEKYETILSGDLDGNDVAVNDPCELLEETTRGENSYHVVTATDCDGTTLLEGLTITGGNANSSTYQDRQGGGLYNGAPTVSHCKIISNSASYGGGIKFYYGGKVTDSIISGNCGGGIYRPREVVNCIINGNYGCGVEGLPSSFLDGSNNAIITDCIISNNKGGGLRFDSSSPIVTRCSFIGNSATCGGAVWMHGCNGCGDCYPEFHQCRFIGNSAEEYGGALYSINDCSPTLVNCLLVGNRAGGAGGAVYDYQSYGASLVNCTVSGNWAQYYYSDDYYSYSSRTNCIVWNNYIGGEISGNICPDPCFVNPGYWDSNGTPDESWDDFWVDGDYHLLRDSPCIDAGTDAGVYEDIEGNVRPFDFPGIDNNGELPDFDMGVYEAVAIQGELKILPRTVNRRSEDGQLLAVMRLPVSGAQEDIVAGEPLVLLPGDIKAVEQKIMPTDGGGHSNVRIRAVFDKAELLEAIPDNGEVEVTIIGRFISGQHFYGTDTIRIISSRK